MLGSFSRARRSSSSNQSTHQREPTLSCNHRVLRRSSMDTLSAFCNRSMLQSGSSTARSAGHASAGLPSRRLALPSCGYPSFNDKSDGLIRSLALSIALTPRISTPPRACKLSHRCLPGELSVPNRLLLSAPEIPDRSSSRKKSIVPPRSSTTIRSADTRAVQGLPKRPSGR